jgi:hypothetical protein
MRPRNEERTLTECEEDARGAADEAEIAAFEALLDTPPRSAGGALAMIEYLKAFDFDTIPGATPRFIATRLRSPLITREGIASAPQAS